jgi:hypothetical protein
MVAPSALPDKFLERRQFRALLMAASSPLALGLVAAFAVAGSTQGQAVNLGGNNIVADGRTKTNIVVDGNTTKITTQTVSKGTGFNSFSDFQQAAGTRVDLYVPDGAGNLLNIVRNGPVVIDGILNGYKNGEIGGNIYFSDSHGFIVGANGTINVGTLTVNTPTSKFLDGVVRADGSVDDAAAGRLLRGAIPISSDGLISIAGTINAKGGVTLQGYDVDIVGGQVQLDDPVLRQRLLFDSTVNTAGSSEGGALVVRGGEVSIVATNRARIGGSVDVSASGGGKGGSISVRSGKDILVGGTARLKANGDVEGVAGSIDILADDVLTVIDGAFFGARGAGTGAGGFVELSARLARIGTISVDLGSERGAAGTLLLDPYDLIIGGGGDNSITSNGANVALKADNSITVSSGFGIDTTSTIGNAGTITLEAPFITIADGAWLRAGASGSFLAGDIVLRSVAAPGLLSSTAGIVIGTSNGAGAEISGRNVSFTASATADSGLPLTTAHATIAVNAAQISATGAFTAEASANVNGGMDSLPVGVVVADVLSSVKIAGGAQITAASASLKATSSVTSNIATQSLAPEDSTADGAVAISTITSKASVDVSGSAKLTIAGALNLAAKNDIVSVVDATPKSAQFGASVAVSVITAETSATIGGNAQISAGSLSLAASTTTAVKVTAKAAAGGGGEPQDGSQTKDQLDKYGDEASTSDGQVSVVGGLAVSDLTSTTLAQMASAVAATVSGATSITAQSANSAEVVADGSAVKSDIGVGVAVGINLAHVSNDALAAQSLSTGSLNVSAGMGTGGNVFTTAATSGAGAADVGVAGSLAVNLIDTQSTARLGGVVTITGHGAVALSAANATKSVAKATPTEDGASGDTVGVGVSAAINIVGNRSVAEFTKDATLDGAGSVTLSATGVYEVESEAKAGSKGGISLTPALALSMVSNATTAQLGSGATLSAGSVSLSATQQSTTTTTASAKAAGKDVAIGAALALALINDEVTATTARSISASGSISFAAMGASFSTLTAEASATGGKAADDKGDAEPGKDVDGQVSTQLEGAKGKQDKANIGDTKQKAKTDGDVADKDARSASTSEGGVSVAAAVGINVQTANVLAGVPDNVAITAGGTLTLSSAANTDGKITADGSAVGAEGDQEAKIGIGAAVAVNKVSASNAARLGAADHVLGGLTIEALKTDIAAKLANDASTATRADSYLASATSGAGGSKVGVAGSLALNLVDTEASARIAGNAKVTLTGGAVSLSADNQSGVVAKALPVEAGTSGGKVGVGVSAAINILANRSVAEIENGAVVSGAGALALSANGIFTTEAEAKAGAQGGISITPALALNLASNTTTARIGSGGTLVAGSVSVAASQQSTVTTTASAKAAGGDVAVGASLALALINDDVMATTARSITTSGAIRFSAEGKSVGTLTAEASASGAKSADDDGKADGEKDVDGKVDDQLATAKDKQDKSGVGDTAQKTKTDADVNGNDAKSKRSAKSSEGKVSVAAAVAVNVETSSVIAAVPDGVVINAGGSLTISSANTTSGKATADGSAVGESGSQSKVGIGVAAAVNVVDKTNIARLGNAAHSADGVTISATQYGDPANPDVDTYESTATSGAGGSKVGIAGSLALNLINARATAEIASGGSVNAKSGASVIVADQRIAATAKAAPSGDGANGGKVGIGASVALNLITDTTSALLPDGVAFTNGTGLSVTANSTLDTTTTAEAGAGGGIAVDAVVALAQINQTTTARIGTGTGLSMTGAIKIAATSGGTHTASAKGDTKAAEVGVGAAAAVIIGGGTKNGALANTSVTSASLARNVTAASLEISASSARIYTADATATAKGGKEDTATKDSNGKAASGDTLEKTKDSQKGNDAAEQQSSGKGESTGAGGSGSKVTVAAAVGVAAAQDLVSATLAGVTVSTTGAVTVSAANTVDMATSGIGAALNSSSDVGVGIGVALGIINNTTTASIADGAEITQSGSLAVDARSAENTGAGFDKLTALAVAGASAAKVSVAGALAVGISTSQTTASIGNNVVVVSSGNVAVAVDNQSRLSARALSASKGSNVAVGASIATVYADHALAASIGNGANITGKDVSVTALNHKVDGGPSFEFTTDLDKLKDQALNNALLGSANYYAEAMGGALASGGSGVAIQGSFAVMVFSDDVSASVGDNATITATGAVTLGAESDLVAKALTGGISVGGNVGVGVSATVVVSDGTTRSLFGSNASVTQSTSFSSRATASQDIQAFGVAAAGGGEAGIAGVATVIVSKNTVEALLKAGSSVTSSGDVTLAARNDFSSFALATGVGLGGTVGIGAAASVVTVNNVTRAALADGNSASAVKIDTGGAVNLTAAATQTGSTITAAGGAAGTVGAGAGAAVYVLGTTTEALVGAYAQIGQTNSPSRLTVEATDVTDLTTVAGALGGGGTAGIGAGAAVGVVGKTVTAQIGNNANVKATDVRVAAHSAETALTTAIGFGVGGTAGVAGAVTVYSVDNATTARIGTGAKVLATNNVAVLASDDVDIAFISGTGAGGGSAAVGAAASVAVVSNSTLATIAGNASVTALGQGAAINYVTGYDARLGSAGDDFAASLDGTGYAYDTTSTDGEVLTADEAQRQGLRLLALSRDVTPTTASANGVIVNATGETAVRSLAVGGAVSGGVSVSISANVPVITTSIIARIDAGASINVDNNAGAVADKQSVIVAAAGDTYRAGLAGSLAGGVVGVGGGLDTAIFSPTITASIGATVNAGRDVMVSARGREDFVGVSAAAGVGASVGVAGGVSVLSLDSKTTASIGGGARIDAGGNVAVIADDVTRTSTMAGAVAVGVGGGGVGGAVGVTLLTKSTQALIAANAQVTGRGNYGALTVYDGSGFSATRSDARGVVVSANSNESLFTLGIAGAGGLYVGVAGAVSVQLLDVTTNAAIGAGAKINTASGAAHAQQDVVVVARDSASVAAIDGGLAIGAGALSGAVDVGILRNTTSASIGDGATINAARRVDVAALQNVNVSSTVVSGAAGLVGIAGGVSVYSIGDGIAADSEGGKQIGGDNNVAGYVGGQSGDGTANDVLGSSSDSRVTGIGTKMTAARAALDVETQLNRSAPPAGTSAMVGAATITAGGSVSVASIDKLGTKTIAGAVAGGAVGLGFGVGVVTVDTTNTAQITGNATINGGSVKVAVDTAHSLTVNSLAGAFGIIGAQASVAVLNDNAATRARITGATLATAGDVVVRASDTRTGTVEANGVAVGFAGAVGVSMAVVNLGGSVEASLGQGVKIGNSGAKAGSVSVTATSKNTAEAEAFAASGGIGLAAAGGVAEANTTTAVDVTADNASIYAVGDVLLSGAAAGTASADAKGFALAGYVAAGGSLAHASVGEQVNTHLFGGSLINAGSITLAARLAQGTTTPLVSASATGSAGAMVGLTATEAKAANNSKAAVLAEKSTLSASGAVLINAASRTSQSASASGLAIGVVAAGSNSASATSNTITTALLSDMVGVEGAAVRILANGDDTNEANAVSGSGGLIAGAAANVSTSSTSTTRAAADTSSTAAKYLIAAIGGDVEINATHTDTFRGKVDSTQASLAGASGANITHQVASIVDAHLGNNAYVRATNFSLAARNLVRNYYIGENAGNTANFNSDNAGWNVDSGSGGLINLPAGSAVVNIGQTTSANIGSNADIHLMAPGGRVSALDIEAYNQTVSHQKSKLDSGGAIALADTAAKITANVSASIAIGGGSDIAVDLGDIAVAAWGNADLRANAAATTYGLAGAPSGRAYADYTASNRVDLGENVRLEASNSLLPTNLLSGQAPTHGTVSLNAGAGLSGQTQKIALHTTVDLFNKTAIPIDTTPDARATVNSKASVTIAKDTGGPTATTTYGVNAAGDITVRANGGLIDATAVGTGKDLYLEALSAAASAISGLFGGGDITFEHHGGTTSVIGEGTVTVDGLIDTGLQRHKTLTLSYDPNCNTEFAACIASTASANIDYTVGGPEDVGTQILNRVDELKLLLDQYKSDPVAAGAYNSELNFLYKKLAALGLGSFDNDGNFKPNEYSGPSPRAQKEAEAATTLMQVNAGNAALGTATGAAVDDAIYGYGGGIAAAYADATHGLTANAEAAKTAIAGSADFHKYYDATVDDGHGKQITNPNRDAGFAAAYDALVVAIADGKAAAAVVGVRVGVPGATGDTTSNAYHEAQIAQLTLDMQTLQTQLTAALVSNPTAAAGIRTQIANKQTAINTELGAIASNNSLIASNAQTASDKANAVKSALVTLFGKLGTDGGTALANVNSALNGATLSGTDPDTDEAISGHQPGISEFAASLTAAMTASGTTITTLTGSGTGSLTVQLANLGTLASTYAGQKAAAASLPNTASAPQAFVIEVADTMAQLGNVSIYADKLKGTGALLAPGDASIDIVNNTANTLKLNNLVIPSYDAGRLRLNGVLVTSNAEINALNPAGTSANFATVTTAQSSSRPRVSITSNYNPDSVAFYNPSGTLAQRGNHVAPDIILNSGKTIDNLTGAVEMTSAAGNIYVNGTINAGSVSILAKNGDFVSSYVNGFDHIGGDPASFNDPTRASEAGKGITANGAISIAARYININSTIQSGIADWNLNLSGLEKLTTTDPTAIGLTQAQIDAKIATYQAALTAAATDPTKTPSMLIDMGGGVFLNMAAQGLDATDLQAKIKAYLQGVVAAGTGTQPNPVVTVNRIGGGTETINIKDYLSPDVRGRLEFTMATAQTYQTGHPSAASVFGVISPTSNIGVSYDAKNGQYVVDGTSVRGGYIQLYGQIMNTAASGGQLNVLDGFGTINITNTSNIAVVLQTLKTGDDPNGNGRGTAGIIDITDVRGVDTTNPANPVVSVLHSVYTRDYVPGSATGQVKVQTQTGYIDPRTGEIVDASGQVLSIGGVAKVSTGGDRSATYIPASGQRYVWTTGEYKENITNFSLKQTQLFGSSALTVSEHTHFDSVDGPHQLNYYRLSDGTYVTTAGGVTQSGSATAVQTNQGIVLINAPKTTPNTDLTNTPFISSTDAYRDGGDANPVETGRHRNCNWWTLCIASNVTINFKYDQKYTVITTNSLKADNPIKINFIGSDTGGITVNSASNVVLTGGVSAAAGDVSITATGTGSSIIEGNLAGEITGKNVTLNADGSVGGVTYGKADAAPDKAAIAVTLTGGALTANAADGNVVITSRGDLNVRQVTAAGSVKDGKGAVNLVASKSITGADASAFIQGPRVSLTAVNGAIGSTANGKQLLVNTGYSADPALRQFGDPSLDSNFDPNPLLGLTAVAGGDIGIRSAAWSGNADGTMLLDKAISLGGDVRLTSSGWILDNNPVEGIDSRTYDQLLGYWESLGLLATDADRGITSNANAEKQAKAIAAFENATTQSYEQYWQMRRMQADGGTAYDPGFVYKIAEGSPQYAAFVQQFGAADAPAKIAEFEAAQTSLYQALNGQVGGLTATYKDGYRYLASDAEQAALTKGSVWTERELAFSLSPGALKTITATNPVVKEPNVSGRTVTLEAQKGIGETVGAGTANVGISIRADLDPRYLTLDQKVALAAAERSDLQLKVHFEGVTVDIPLGADESKLTDQQKRALAAVNAKDPAATDVTIVILAKRPLNFNAPTAINVTVADAPSDTVLDRGTAYLASRTAALLGAISVQGETRVKVIGSIGNAASGSVSTGNLILESAQGNIGSSGTPLALSLLSGATFTARAQNGVFVNLTGDALIDTVYSPKDIVLTATGSLLNANKDTLINVLGANVSLTAGGTLGAADRALNVGNQLGGGITATAAGLINLYGPSNNLFIIKSATSSAGSITLTAGFEGVIAGAVTAPGQISLVAGGRFVIDNLGQLHSTVGGIDVRAGSLAMNAGATMTADLGRISIATDDDALIDGTVTAGDQISVATGGRFVIDSLGQLRSTGGMIDVRAASLKMINGATMTADVGRIFISTTGDALVTGIESKASDDGVHSAIEIASGGRVFAGTAGSRDFDLKAMSAGASVKVTAALGIGDKTQADAKGQDGPGDVPGSANAVTDTPNPLRILASTLALEAVDGGIHVAALAADVTAHAMAGNGNIDLTAAGRLHGTALSAQKGSVYVTAEGDLVLDDVIAGTESGAASGQVTARSRTGALTIGTVRSGGTQRFAAQGDIKFASLTTTGMPGDIGDVRAKSTAGAIIGGDIAAHGSIYLSGKGVSFGSLGAGVDSTINSSADIIGAEQIAGGTLTDTADGDIRIGLVRGARVNFDAGGTLALDKLEVAEEVTLRAGTLDVKIKQVPAGPQPLKVTLTGSKGGVGTFAHVDIDAPAVIMPLLRFYESEISTTAHFLSILSAYVPGSAKLTTPLQTLLVENRSPRPLKGYNVQMYQPDFAFALTLDRFHTSTDAFVVRYDRSAQVTDLLNHLPFDGASLVRDSIRAMMHAQPVDSMTMLITGPDGRQDEREFFFEKRAKRLVIDGITYPVGTVGAGPAVQLSELN